MRARQMHNPVGRSRRAYQPRDGVRAGTARPLRGVPWRALRDRSEDLCQLQGREIIRTVREVSRRPRSLRRLDVHLCRSRLHPGEILKEEFLVLLGISQNQLAIDIRVPALRISAIVRGKRAISADTTLRFGAYFKMEPQFWLNRHSSRGGLALMARRRSGGRRDDADENGARGLKSYPKKGKILLLF